MVVKQYSKLRVADTIDKQGTTTSKDDSKNTRSREKISHLQK